jgi:hypothetical protein
MKELGIRADKPWSREQEAYDVMSGGLEKQ